MYKTSNEGLPTPTANLAINKSRIKLYGKNSKIPTYYLQKGQEFQIELFNPTKDTVCAKISLNGKPIAQGGLVLKPAQRVFLDRYIDVARKFKFDTYEVANTSETRAAIEDNGDFKVEFYKEMTPPPVSNNPHIWINNNRDIWGGPNNNIGFGGTLNTYYNNTKSSGEATLDSFNFMDQSMLRSVSDKPRRKKSLKSKKSIETGRVEQGASSDQTLKTVYMNWETVAFHTIEYKMLPVSQKVNTVKDTQVKRYCTNCGARLKANFRFCPSCGSQA